MQNTKNITRYYKKSEYLRFFDLIYVQHFLLLTNLHKAYKYKNKHRFLSVQIKKQKLCYESARRKYNAIEKRVY